MSAPGGPDRAQAAAQVALLSGTGRVLSGGVQMIADFVVASRLIATGYPEAALERLLPPQEWRGRRLAVIVAVGALLTGLRTPRVRAGELTAALAAGSRGGELTAQVLAAGTRLDCRTLDSLIITHSDEVLVPVLHDLLIRFAALDWRAADHERALLHDMVALAHRAPELSHEQLRTALAGVAEAAARLGGDPR